MFGENVEIVQVKFELRRMKDDFVKFNCGGVVRGIIHVPVNGDLTVILDGGYLLGAFDCVNCASNAITDIHVKFYEADKKCGMSYQAYKGIFSSATSSAKVH